MSMGHSRRARHVIAPPCRGTARCAHAGDKRRGQSLTEFALTLPLLCLLVAGVLDLAHTFSLAGILANAAREGARYGATKPTDTDGIKTRTVEEAAGAPLTLDPSEVNVATDSGAVSGNPITVDVTHQVTLLLAPALGLPPLTIHRSATMVIF